MQFRCPNCQHAIRIEERDDAFHLDETLDTIECPSCHSRFNLSSDCPSTVSYSPGRMIAHFEVRQLLGEGSFGTVFKAWDTELHRYVALKIPREGRITKDTAKLFLREARAAASVSHPHVVSVYEMGQQGDSFYIASELIDGITLSEYLKSKTLDPDAAARLVIKLLRGIQVFHAKGIIHRDLKPGNILMDSRNEPHISDFGLARLENQTDVTVTQSGRIVGTLLYMPPEQARGEIRSLSARSDIYSIGVILYELLTGVRPFAATSSRTLMHSILTEEPRPPRSLRRSISVDLETICLKALDKDAGNRFASADEMADELNRYLQRQPIQSRRISYAGRVARLVRRNPMVSAICLLLMAAVGAIIFMAARIASEPENPAPSPTPVAENAAPAFPVQISYSLSGQRVPGNTGADWVVLPLSSRDGTPNESAAIRVSQSAVLSAQLPPGDYLVVVSVPEFGFHEVYRRVPEQPDSDVKPTFPHESWKVDESGNVLLPEILIRDDADTASGMIRVPGGDFIMGDGIADRPPHQVSIEEFLVDAKEVTAAEFERFVRLPADYELPRGDFPVCVPWHTAIAYAEFVGKRLVLEPEFEYLATDLGRSLFPGGDEPAIAAGAPWTYEIAGEPSADRLSELPIFGIHSNVAEWTGSWKVHYPGARDPGPEIDRRMNLNRKRVVRGGPVTLGPNDRALNTWNNPVTHREAWDMDRYDSEIGFRCARSIRPRYLQPATGNQRSLTHTDQAAADSPATFRSPEDRD